MRWATYPASLAPAAKVPTRRWLDEDYDYDAPEEVARRNELFEAFGNWISISLAEVISMIVDCALLV